MNKYILTLGILFAVFQLHGQKSTEKSADEIAQELSNTLRTIASLEFQKTNHWTKFFQIPPVINLPW
ncbi:hypothetical protein [Flavicella marina]|uniref:hypothetical protein n=1 Tax=Flavicella marina TaxID=1475951 RepID=UPI0012648296|nr:hypothetical protein [Flavicella marina]